METRKAKLSTIIEEMNNENRLKEERANYINMKNTSEEAIAPEEIKVETPKKKRGRPVKVQNEIFVEMWSAALANGSLQEVAGSLGMSVGSASVKACNLRKAGYDLPQFKRGRSKKTEQPQQ